jgi:hypothetical protein
MACAEQEDAAWNKNFALSNVGVRTPGMMKRIQLVGQRGSRDFPLD